MLRHLARIGFHDRKVSFSKEALRGRENPQTKIFRAEAIRGFP
jgi:hypothetical protein